MRNLGLLLAGVVAISAGAAEWPVLRTYEGECLRRVKMPLGGIGTGTISLSGTGALVDWELMGRPDKGFTPSAGACPFFAIRTETSDGRMNARILEGPVDTEDYEGESGARARNHGFVRWRDCVFKAAYPLAQMELKDAALPVTATLEAMNPLLPGEEDASGIPTALLRWRIVNASTSPLKASVICFLANPASGTGRVERVAANGLAGVRLGAEGPDILRSGEIVLALPQTCGAITTATDFDGSNWMSGFDGIWRQFAASGRAQDFADSERCGKRRMASVAVEFALKPGETKSLPFALAWRFAHRYAWSKGADGKPVDVGNWYATRYPTAFAAAQELLANLGRYEQGTVAFVESVLARLAPDVVKEAALFNLSTLRSETCFRTADGHFFGWEGCFDKAGSCFGSCTHVWGYEHALVDLWPALAKDMTELQFGPAMDARGCIRFRLELPLDANSKTSGCAAADGQMQCLVKAYENWRKTGDDAWMKRLYPSVRKAMEFAWVENGWDGDRDGVMEGCQHNTMDVEYYGPNPQMEFLYLAALKATAAMADAAGDAEFAAGCRALAEKGSAWTEKQLFNGEYYEHKVVTMTAKPADGTNPGNVPDPNDPVYQLAAGCLVDQLVGDYAARAVGLGPVADERHAAKTLETILVKNASTNAVAGLNHMRSFAMQEEPALKMAWYPKDRLPKKPFPYYGENLTGFEYVVAANLAQRGRLAEAEKVVKDVRDRYDGRKRNPFDEAECGHHYARALTAWSVLCAFDGLDIDKLCPPKPETAAKFDPAACPPPAKPYREAARAVYRYMTSLPAMTTLVETGKPNQKYQHNAYVAKTHAAHIWAMLDWAKAEPDCREKAMRFAKASAEYLLGELEPADAVFPGWPPTYGRKPLEFDPKTDGPYKKFAMIGNEPEGAVKYRGEVMLIYPAEVGIAFVDYYDETKDARFLAAATRIGETFLKTRRPDGSWPLKMKLATGEVVGENILVPDTLLTFFERLHAATGDARWRTAEDAAFAWLEAHPLTDWNWDGQFEDIKPEKPYLNPTKHNAIATMMYILRRFPGDKARLALCRRILEFCEKRFVVWKAPPNHPKWPAPSVLEQYSCFTPIDASAAKMISGYLAIYRAEGRAEDYEKARALGNMLTRVQKPSGRIPTFWEGLNDGDSGLSDERYDWLNCMTASARALTALAGTVPPERNVRCWRPDARPTVAFSPVEKACNLFDARLLSDRARGEIFEEALNAFRTHFDDVHPQGKAGRMGWWQGEYWGKGMLSHCAYARATGDEDEKAFILKRALELVSTFQRADGYLATYEDADFVKGWNWNVWSRKYTLWALIEAYDLTGDERLLAAARKMVVHLDGQLKRLGLTFGDTGCFCGLPSMSILKPLLLLYRRTGEPTALALARQIVAENDREDGRCPNLIANAFSDRPVHTWYPKPDDWAKAYELMSVVEGFVLYSQVTGEKRPLEAAERIFGKLLKDELNGVCSVGFHDHFLGAGAAVNTISESCDVIHWMRLCRFLHETSGRTSYLDLWERAYLNAFLAGVYRDGSWATHDVRGHGRRHLIGMFEVQMYHHFCCLANDPRGFVDYLETALVARSPEAFDLNFYTDGDYAVAGLKASVRGNYPVEDRVTVRLTASRSAKLRLRVPDWCEGLDVDGRRVTAHDGRAEVEVPAGESSLALAFAMPVRVESWKPGRSPDPALAGLEQEWFEMSYHNREMAGLSRKTAGVRVFKGPLLLAKGTRAGAGERETLGDLGIDESWRVTLVPRPAKQTWGLWDVTFEKGAEKKTVRASDYQSVVDGDAWRDAFSIWF